MTPGKRMVIPLRKMILMGLAFRLSYRNALGFNPGLKLSLKYAALRLRRNLLDRDRLRWYARRAKALLGR